jgi:hypothetical protein
VKPALNFRQLKSVWPYFSDLVGVRLWELERQELERRLCSLRWSMLGTRISGLPWG